VPYTRVGHSLDIPFFINNLAAPCIESYSGPNPPQKLATFEHDRFADFICDGVPGWPQYARDRLVAIFDHELYVVSGLDI
jgi:para-nitrobenzyl esterase